MTTYVSFLRAINVGGTGKILMADLRDLYEELGCLNVRTILQTGNVIFDAKKLPHLSKAIEDRFNHSTVVVVRKLSDIRKIVEAKPFSRFRIPTNLQMVMFLNGKPKAKDFDSLPREEGEEIWEKGEEIYITYPNGSGRSKLTIQKIEKAIGVEGTMRNWNTVEKIL